MGKWSEKSVGIIPLIQCCSDMQLVIILFISVADSLVILVGLFINGTQPRENDVLINEDVALHPASGFKTAFDLDLLSRGQVMLCQRFNAHIFD